MFFDNPMYFFAFAVVSLIFFIIMSKLGIGYIARWITLGAAVIMWWTAAGGPIEMWNQAYDAGTNLVTSIRSIAPFAETENIVPTPTPSPDETGDGSSVPRESNTTVAPS